MAQALIATLFILLFVQRPHIPTRLTTRGDGSRSRTLIGEQCRKSAPVDRALCRAKKGVGE